MEERKRAVVLGRVIAGRLTIPEAALLLGLSARSVWRVRSRFVAADLDPAALAHGNAGRAAAHRLDPELAARVVAFAKDGYAGINDTHLSETARRARGHRALALEHFAASCWEPGSRVHVGAARRHTAAGGSAGPPRACSCSWMPVGTAGSGRRGPSPACTAPSTTLPATCWPRCSARRRTPPGISACSSGSSVPSAYRWPHTATATAWFWRSPRERESIEEELLGRRQPTQFGRALGELGIELILANSPRAKGRVERLFGTFQDRLVGELRLAGIRDLARANAFLRDYLPRHNSRFAIAPADGEPAWRTLPSGLSVESVCCFKYSRIVASDNTVQLDGAMLQLPPRVRGSWASSRVELRHYFDGSFSVHAPGGRELARSSVPQVTPKMRAREWSRAPIGGVTPLPRDREHPWRRYAPGSLRGRPPLTEYPNR